MKRFLPYLIREDLYLVKEDLKRPDPGEDISSTEHEDQERKILNKSIFLMEQEKSGQLPPKLQELLDNILRAVQLTREEILLILIHPDDPDQAPLAHYQMKDCKIIGFMESVPTSCQSIFDTGKYNLFYSTENVSMLADPLGEIYQDRSKKIILWNKLKELYQL
jgi:hypothetical protein